MIINGSFSADLSFPPSYFLAGENVAVAAARPTGRERERERERTEGRTRDKKQRDVMRVDGEEVIVPVPDLRDSRHHSFVLHRVSDIWSSDIKVMVFLALFRLYGQWSISF